MSFTLRYTWYVESLRKAARCIIPYNQKEVVVVLLKTVDGELPMASIGIPSTKAPQRGMHDEKKGGK